MFSFEYCEISKNTFFTEHLRATASAYGPSLPNYPHFSRSLELREVLPNF